MTKLAITAATALGLLVTGSLAVAGSFGSDSSPSPRGGPPGTTCGAFPDPVTIAAPVPSLPDQTAWHQNISLSPVAANSDAIINGLPGDLHPDFGSPLKYGIPYKVVGANAKKTKVKFTAYGSESDKGPYRIPLNTPIEGGKNGEGDRHVVVYDSARCLLYELFNAFPDKKKKRWEADGGAIWDLTSPGLRREG